MGKLIYKICDTGLWREAEESGIFNGAPVDIADGYIHFSTAEQVRETAVKHFSGCSDLILAAVDAGKLGGDLKYEVSRGGAPFPHFYGPLPMSAVVWVKPLLTSDDGSFLFPELGR